MRRSRSRADARKLCLAANAAGHLQFDQTGKELDMIRSLCRRLARQFAIFPQNGRQPPGFEAMVRQDLRSFGHADCPRIRDV